MEKQVNEISEKRNKYYVELFEQTSSEIETIKSKGNDKTPNEQYRLVLLNSEKKWLEEIITNQMYLERSISSTQDSILDRDRLIFEMMQTREGNSKLLKLCRQESKKEKKFTKMNEIVLPEKSFPLLSNELQINFGKYKGNLELDDSRYGILLRLVSVINEAFNEEMILNLSLLNYEKLSMLLNLNNYDYKENLRVFTELSYFIDTISFNAYRRLLRKLNSLESKKLSFLYSDEIKETKIALNNLTYEIRSELIRRIEKIFDEYRTYFGKVYDGDTTLYEIVKNRQLFNVSIKRVNAILKELELAIKNYKVKVVYDEKEQRENNRELSSLASDILKYEVTDFNLDGVDQYNMATIYKNVYLSNVFNNALDYEKGYSLRKK